MVLLIAVWLVTLEVVRGVVLISELLESVLLLVCVLLLRVRLLVPVGFLKCCGAGLGLTCSGTAISLDGTGDCLTALASCGG